MATLLAAAASVASLPEKGQARDAVVGFRARSARRAIVWVTVDLSIYAALAVYWLLPGTGPRATGLTAANGGQVADSS